MHRLAVPQIGGCLIPFGGESGIGGDALAAFIHRAQNGIPRDGWPASADFSNHFAAWTGSAAMPWPSRYLRPMMASATGLPALAAAAILSVEGGVLFGV